jgi:hypothetical protein
VFYELVNQSDGGNSQRTIRKTNGLADNGRKRVTVSTRDKKNRVRIESDYPRNFH